MAARFMDLDRQTPMLLPCDLREWVPEDHIVHLILDAVEQIPTAHFRVNDRGTGSPQYPPCMMLAYRGQPIVLVGPVRISIQTMG